MKLAEAKAVCAALLWRQYEKDNCLKLQAELISRLTVLSPQISSPEPGIFLLDASGLAHMGGESKFCRNLQKLITSIGIAELNIGIADSAFAAQVASKFKRSRQYIVPAGKDREFLFPLSLQHLPLSAQMHDTLRALGVKTIAQLLQIPAQDLQERFGKEGLLALDLSSAFDKTRPQIVKEPKLCSSFLDLNFPVESLAQTQFILKSMLDGICSRLKGKSLLAEELRISFFNEKTRFEKRALELIRPSSNAKFLHELIKLSLEASPLAREYTAIEIVVSRSAAESWQQKHLRIVDSSAQKENGKKEKQLKLLDKGRDEKNEQTRTFSYQNNEGQAEPFALLVQKLSTRIGPGSLVRAAACDQHIPDLAACFLPIAEKAGSVLPVSISSGNANTNAPASALACGLVLKKTAHPSPILVEYKGKTPAAVSYQGQWHRIKELTEPERLSGLWWERPLRKSYYVALLEAASERPAGARGGAAADKGGGSSAGNAGGVSTGAYLALLVHDHENKSWHLDGFFD